MIWTSKLYRSKYSKHIETYVHVEGATRQEALTIIARLAKSHTGRAGEHARAAISGTKRHTLTPDSGYYAYAAVDGSWKNHDGKAFAQWE